MKTSELTGGRLDFWVAKAEGQDKLPGFRMGAEGPEREHDHRSGYREVDHLTYSSNWRRGGPIIERERIELHCISRNGVFVGEWMARITPIPLSFGPTPLIASMRAYVASKFGEEVPDGN